jgi:predicted amidohydrolase
MSQDISIALVQADLAWKDKKANLLRFDTLIKSMKEVADIIILPEMFNTAFCVDDMSLAEDENGETVSWMKQTAKEKNCAVCGSILFREDGNYYNRYLFVRPDGNILHYNKHHLFSLVNENQLLTNGEEKLIIGHKGWKIQPFICYDLRFPAWCQNDENADLQLYVANWPSKRIPHWSALLKSRAIENQCYVAGVNRLGKDAFGNEHTGHSAVYDFTGAEISSMESRNGIEIVKLSKPELEKHRQRYPFWKDRDTFGEE